MNDSTGARPWIALARHGISEWNERGLIQGRADIALSAAGAAKLRRAKVGDEFLRARWCASPLRRARQTAAILNPQTQAVIHPDLIEADWGDFEGLRRDSLARRIRGLGLAPARGLDFAPARGLDFAPPGGESPRQVQRRLMKWFAAVAADNPGRPVVAVTHKGVIRSALSLACDWDMAEDFALKVKWELPHIFRYHCDGGGGKLQLLRLNCPWSQPPASSAG